MFGVLNNILGLGGSGTGSRPRPLLDAITNLVHEIEGVLNNLTNTVRPSSSQPSTQNNQSGNFPGFGGSSASSTNFTSLGGTSSAAPGGAANATGSSQMSKSDQASAQMSTSFDNAISSASQTLRVSTDGQASLNALRSRPN